MGGPLLYLYRSTRLPWDSHGIPMGFPWCSHRPAVFTRNSHGIPMVFPSARGVHTELRCSHGVSHGIPMELPWAFSDPKCSHGVPMNLYCLRVFPWIFTMGTPWEYHGSPKDAWEHQAHGNTMGVPSEHHESPMGTPLEPHGNAMGVPWGSHQSVRDFNEKLRKVHK